MSEESVAIAIICLFFFLPILISIMPIILLIIAAILIYKKHKRTYTNRYIKEIKYDKPFLREEVVSLNTPVIVRKKSLDILSKTESHKISVKVITKKLPFTYGDQELTRHCEFLVERYLSTLNKNEYTVINNVTIPSFGGNTTNVQIDHVVVSRYGIFSIETKSHRGWIYCKDFEQKWIQILPRTCNTFPSPSRQNYAHVCALRGLLGDDIRVIPIVVLTSADAIMKKGNVKVGNIGYLLNEIDNYKKCIYTKYEYEKIIDLIKSANKNDKETAYQHKLKVSNLVASLSY